MLSEKKKKKKKKKCKNARMNFKKKISLVENHRHANIFWARFLTSHYYTLQLLEMLDFTPATKKNAPNPLKS